MKKAIDEAIFYFERNHRGERPDVIIMHPVSWDNYLREVLYEENIMYDPEKLMIKGIPVLRSLDIDEKKFKLY
jgi:hypothetical protein